MCHLFSIWLGLSGHSLLITALRFLNCEIEKENKHTTQEANLHTEESSRYPAQQNSEWSQTGSKKRKQRNKNQNNANNVNGQTSSRTDSRNQNGNKKLSQTIARTSTTGERNAAQAEESVGEQATQQRKREVFLAGDSILKNLATGEKNV